MSSSACRVASGYPVAERKRTRRANEFISVAGILGVVHGLMITSDFALPGFTVKAGEFGCSQRLRLIQSHANRLATNWEPQGAERIWHGRQGDGQDLAIERDASDRLLFSYGARARFLLDEHKETLECATASDPPDWCRVLIGKIIPAIAVMRGFEALHAAVVDSGTGVVAIMAPSGTGKSTLAGALMSRGWRLFADDQLTLARSAAGVVALPGSRHMNIARTGEAGAATTDALGETLWDFDEERWLAAEHVQTRPRPVEMLCLLERGTGLHLACKPLPANPLPLSPYLLGLAADPRRLRSQFMLLADLVEEAPLVRLTAGLQDPPDSIAELLARGRDSRELVAVTK